MEREREKKRNCDRWQKFLVAVVWCWNLIFTATLFRYILPVRTCISLHLSLCVRPLRRSESKSIFSNVSLGDIHLIFVSNIFRLCAPVGVLSDFCHHISHPFTYQNNSHTATGSSGSSTSSHRLLLFNKNKRTDFECVLKYPPIQFRLYLITVIVAIATSETQRKHLSNQQNLKFKLFDCFFFPIFSLSLSRLFNLNVDKKPFVFITSFHVDFEQIHNFGFRVWERFVYAYPAMNENLSKFEYKCVANNEKHLMSDDWPLNNVNSEQWSAPCKHRHIYIHF